MYSQYIHTVKGWGVDVKSAILQPLARLRGRITPHRHPWGDTAAPVFGAVIWLSEPVLEQGWDPPLTPTRAQPLLLLYCSLLGRHQDPKAHSTAPQSALPRRWLPQGWLPVTGQFVLLRPPVAETTSDEVTHNDTRPDCPQIQKQTLFLQSSEYVPSNPLFFAQPGITSESGTTIPTRKACRWKRAAVSGKGWATL